MWSTNVVIRCDDFNNEIKQRIIIKFSQEGPNLDDIRERESKTTKLYKNSTTLRNWRDLLCLKLRLSLATKNRKGIVIKFSQEEGKFRWHKGKGIQNNQTIQKFDNIAKLKRLIVSEASTFAINKHLRSSKRPITPTYQISCYKAHKKNCKILNSTPHITQSNNSQPNPEHLYT